MGEVSSAGSLPLAALRKGDAAVVVDVVDDGQSLGDADGSTLARRLGELGFVPGADVEIVAVMWLGGDPIAVRVGGSTFALRLREANQIHVRRTSSAAAPQPASAVTP
jgi:ferrous iron transport protein A